MDKYIGPGKLIDYSWDDPIRAFISIGVSLLVVTFIMGFVLRFAGAGVMMFSSPGLYGDLNDAVMTGVDGNDELAGQLTGNATDWPSECTKAEDGTGGGGAAECTAALEQRANNAEIQAIITNLQGLGLTNASITEAHDAYGDDYEKSGWNKFHGGSKLQAYVGRPSTLEDANGGVRNAKPEDAVSLGGLKALANAAVTHSQGQGDAAVDFQDSVSSYVYKSAGDTMQALFGAFFFFLIVGSFWAMTQACTGHMRTAMTLIVFLLVLLYIGGRNGRQALEALDLSQASGGTFDTLLGPFAAILSQALVFLQKVVGAVTKTISLENIVVAATFWMVVTVATKWAFAAGVYIMLTYQAWLGVLGNGGELAFSPFDLDALDASFLLPPLVWVLNVLGMVVGLYLLVGAWRHLGQKAIDKAGEVCAGACSDEPATARTTPHTPMVPPSEG
jgi:hypothetical protein